MITTEEVTRMRITGQRLIVAVLLLSLFPTGAATAAPNGPGTFGLHLECADGNEYDIVVASEESFAALVEGSNTVAVLKGQAENVDGSPDWLLRGFSIDRLVACDTFRDDVRIYVAYVLFTPRRT